MYGEQQGEYAFLNQRFKVKLQLMMQRLTVKTEKCLCQE